MPKSILSSLQKRSSTLLGTSLALGITIALTITSPLAVDLPITSPITPPVTPPTTPTPTPTPSPDPTGDIKIHTNSLGAAREGRFYLKRVKATDQMPNSGLMVGAAGLPEGLKMDHCYNLPSFHKTTTYCYILGTPQENGDFEVTLMAENIYGDTELKELELKVREGRHWPSFPWRH